MINKNIKTKEGAASIFVVIFATLLVGIISVGFVQLVMRSNKNTVDNDLANSAYDAALVGIEDAQRAILEPPKPGVNMGSDNCYFVSEMLYNLSTEVTVEHGYDAASGIETNEAYTCVTVEDKVSDYRGVLNSTNVVAVIPLTEEANGTEMKKIKVKWTKKGVDEGSLRYNNESNFNEIHNEVDKANPPTLSFQYVQIGGDKFSYDDFIEDNNGKRLISGSSSSKILLTANDNNAAGISTIVSYDKFTSSYEPINVDCDNSADYACTAVVNVIGSGGVAEANKYLILSLPYGGPETNFMVEMLDGSDQVIKFSGVQYLVDSTGRADDLYTRIEARLSTVDPNAPYPQFAAHLRSDDKSIEKNFWVTISNCRVIYDGVDQACSSSGEL